MVVSTVALRVDVPASGKSEKAIFPTLVAYPEGYPGGYPGGLSQRVIPGVIPEAYPRGYPGGLSQRMSHSGHCQGRNETR